MINPKRLTDKFTIRSKHSNKRELRRNINSDNEVIQKLGQKNTTFQKDKSEHPQIRMQTALLLKRVTLKVVPQPAKH